MRRIVVRTDASMRIGGGHVMRGLTLAQELRAAGVRVLFVTRAHPGHAAERIQTAGFPVALLPPPPDTGAPIADGDYARWLGVSEGTDATQTIAALDDQAQATRDPGWQTPDWVIVDHYGLSATWEAALLARARHLMVIDDLANRPHRCNLLLDQNLHANAEARYRALVPADCRLLLGPTRVLLRPAFDAPPPRPRPRDGVLASVLVYFGSGDVHNQAGQALTALAGYPDLAATVILGPDHPHRAAIPAAADPARHRVLDHCTDMAGEMARADLALGVCGIAAWERCACGLASLVVLTAQNQIEDAETLHHLGAALCLGWAEQVTAADWRAALDQMRIDPAQVAAMGRAAATVVAGHTANRRALVEHLSHG